MEVATHFFSKDANHRSVVRLNTHDSHVEIAYSIERHDHTIVIDAVVNGTLSKVPFSTTPMAMPIAEGSRTQRQEPNVRANGSLWICWDGSTLFGAGGRMSFGSYVEDSLLLHVRLDPRWRRSVKQKQWIVAKRRESRDPRPDARRLLPSGIAYPIRPVRTRPVRLVPLQPLRLCRSV